MTLDMDKERREFEARFEEWRISTWRKLPSDQRECPEHWNTSCKNDRWEGWLASKRSMSTQEAGKAEPVARVTGYFSGRCVIEPLQKSLVLPVDMALYAVPINAEAIWDAALEEAKRACQEQSIRFAEAMNGTAAYGARECEKAIQALQSSKQEEKGAGE